MKLLFSIPGKLWWIHNFLDYDMYKGIHDAIIKERKQLNLHSSKGVWQESLINNLVPPLRNTVSNYQPFEKLKTLVKFNPYNQLKDMEKVTTNIHYMKKDAGINWHDDDSNKYGATYYLNHKWHKQWGGEFMFMNKNSDGSDSYGFIPPVGNSVIIVKTPLVHKVNPVLSPIVPRISVQMFIK